jgi:hypothetical protein
VLLAQGRERFDIYLGNKKKKEFVICIVIEFHLRACHFDKISCCLVVH